MIRPQQGQARWYGIPAIQLDLLTFGMVPSNLTATVLSFLALLLLPFRTRLSLQLEILAPRPQLTVCQRSGSKPCLKPNDRLFWAWLSRVWSGWPEALVFVHPSTVTKRQRKRFREHWTGLRRRGKPGRPATAPEIIQLIRRMSQANSGWGARRIAGELEKLGLVLVEHHLRRVLRSDFSHCHDWRTLLALDMDCPEPRDIQGAEAGEIGCVQEVVVALERCWRPPRIIVGGASSPDRAGIAGAVGAGSPSHGIR